MDPLPSVRRPNRYTYFAPFDPFDVVPLAAGVFARPARAATFFFAAGAALVAADFLRASVFAMSRAYSV
jgi:hypothetical protein